MASVAVNRTQALVLGFCAAAWLTLIVILVAAPDVLTGAGKPLPASPAVEWAFLTAITALLGILGVGVVRRWRWMFWVVLLAFVAGVLRVPAAALELAGLLPSSGPIWYVLVQAAVGLVQFAIGLVMVAGLRRAGVWGA